MQRPLGFVLGLAWAALASGAVRAQPATTPVAMYALIVGSNAGGAGQLALRYAEDDARRVAATLIELGGYSADAVDVVVRPTPDALRAHLDRLGARVAADRAAGRKTRVMFYYSGHARSTALDLGADELALGELRQRLLAVSATLMIVVLDACQSGAFSLAAVASPDWRVPTLTFEQTMMPRSDWTTLAFGALGRAIQPFSNRGFWARCAAYAQLGAGLGVAFTRFINANNLGRDERSTGWMVIGGGGVRVDTARGVGFSLGYELDYGPRFYNLFGNIHASGGHRLSAGMSFAY
jgi:hypothetical protein